MKKNISCYNTALWHYLPVFISLILLLFSVNATALNCPGPQDFVRNTDTLWGWFWGLRSNRLIDFTSPYHSWDFYSPYDKNFSPDYTLKAGLYFLKSTTDGAGAARLYCWYELAGGELMEVHTHMKPFSQDEFTRIKNTWARSLKTLKQELTAFTIVVYECSTTAGTADKCSVNFL